jgi:hypothetical protein
MAGLDFEELRIGLYQPDSREQILRHSPAGKVPILHHGDVTVWDSLAICEYAAELAPDAGLWPDERAVRAQARSISAEMHAGFAALRNALQMNVRISGARLVKPPSPEVEADVARVLAIFEVPPAPWRRRRLPVRTFHDRRCDVRARGDAAALLLGAASRAFAGLGRCDLVAGADAGVGGGRRRGDQRFAEYKRWSSALIGLRGSSACAGS